MLKRTFYDNKRLIIILSYIIVKIVTAKHFNHKGIQSSLEIMFGDAQSGDRIRMFHVEFKIQSSVNVLIQLLICKN